MLSFPNNYRAVARKSLAAIAQRLGFAEIAFGVISLFLAQPAFAHHPFGGGTPDNFIEGFLSGLGHPVIGLDHFAFVVAVGLLAVMRKKLGIIIPIAFTLATALGTIIHLQSIDLPIPEVMIALSVLTIGIALAVQKDFNLILLIILSGIAGVFHGFAYGEAIFGAEMTPLGAYLFGFMSIQLVVSAIAFYVGRVTLSKVASNTSLALRLAGSAIAGIGITFLSNAVLG